MKKILAILLAFIMGLSMTACGGDDEGITGEISNKETETKETKEEEVAAIDAIGEAEGTVYENNFLGLGFNLPDGWTFYTKEQINEMNNITQDMLDEDLAAQLEEANLLYDMYALDQYGNSVTVVLEKTSAIASVAIDEKAYAELSVEQVPDALKQVGFADATAEVGTVDFNGKEHAAIDVVATSDSVTLYEKIVCIKAGQYIACITVGTTFENTTDTVLSYFYSLDK